MMWNTFGLFSKHASSMQQPVYVCFIDLRKAYDSVNREAHWNVLQHSYELSDKLVSIIRTIHENSIAAVGHMAGHRKSFQSHQESVKVVYLLPLSSTSTHTVLHLAIDTFNQKGMGIQVAYHLNTNLIGNCRKMHDPIDVVEDFQYLGSTVSDDCTTHSEITQCYRISRASRSFHTYVSVMDVMNGSIIVWNCPLMTLK